MHKCDGYIKVRCFYDHPRKGKDGFIYEHILIAERALGHQLPKNAQIHHVDGNKANNKNSNLVICENQKYHFLLHIRQRIMNWNGDPDKQKICTTCQKLKLIEEMVYNSNRCLHCMRLHMRKYY